MTIMLLYNDIVIHNNSVLYILLVSCSSLGNPTNGMINCSLGDDGAPSYEDTCSFTCNTGYVLNGSESRTCQSDGRWSGNSATCSRGEWFCVVHIGLSVILHQAMRFV